VATFKEPGPKLPKRDLRDSRRQKSVDVRIKAHRPSVKRGGKRNLFRQAQEQVRTNRTFNALSLVDSVFYCAL
jgi:hypothetical protein